MFDEKVRFEGLNRRISRLFESPRQSSTSSCSNEKSSPVSCCPEVYDCESGVSVGPAPSSGSLRESCKSSEDIIGKTSHDEQRRMTSKSALDMEVLTSTAETLPATHQDIQRGLKNDSAMNSNNNANRYSLLGSPFGSKVGAITHKLNYVERVVLEIIETERMYVQDLRSIVEDYLGGIIDRHELPMKPEQVSALFGNIEDIYELNSQLLQHLDSCSEDPVAVASCFVEKSHYFDIYTQYCNNYPNSVATLTECMRNKVLAKFFRERQELLKHTLPLGSYLLKPVQRILKYHLLLQEIAKHFDIDKEGYEVVEEAIETMTGVAWYINDMKRKHEHAVRQQEIQSLLLNWKGMDLTTYGELVLEGTFRVQRARSERTFFLFDKALLITKKRGDHFVYKTHIPCSHLMLIESTRDSLCFTLTHYKNSKQQHNVQAKTVEEKRLWTHHIKKLILENHHAIIPQKAKEAILEMDAMYPGRYRYSPERVKKAMSVIDPTVTQRPGRRQSEPTKQILKHLSENVGLKHAGSDDALLDFEDILQKSLSSLTPICNDPQKERVKEHPGSTEIIRGPEAELTASEEENEEDMHLEDDGQNTDFLQHDTLKGYKRQNSHSPGNPEKRRSIEFTAFNKEILEELENSNSEPEEVYIAGMINTSGIALENPIATTDNQTFEEEAERYPNDSKPVENRNVENADDMKTFSSEEDEEETNIHESSSILPPSVLDQASVIAERFSNNLSRRSSLALEDGKVIGYITPRLLSRSSSLMNLDNTDKSLYQVESSDFLKSHQAVLTNGEKASAECSPSKLYSVESVFEEKDRLIGKQRESVLSFQDRQLIDKIKTYYDKAEHQDASFSIKRRESLTYIPAGVVKNSIFKMNSLPRYSNQSSTRQRSEMHSSSSVCESRQQKTSVDEFTFVQKATTDCSVLHTQPSSTSSESNVQEVQPPTSDEVFTCSAEMIKLWEEIEKEKSRSPDDSFISLPEKPRISIENPVDPHEPLIILEDGDFGSINEKYQNHKLDNSSPGQLSPCNNVSFEDQDCKTPINDHPTFMQLASYMDVNLSDNMKSRVYQLARQYSQRIKCNKPAPYRRIRDLEDDMRRGNLPSVKEEKHEEKCKLKTDSSFPVYNHTISEEHSPTTPTPTSQREKSPKRLSFNSADIPDVSSPIKFDCRSPLSPVKTEKFDWPDVRELRSRYASTARSTKKLPVNRSQSVPDKMTDHNVENMPEAQNKECMSHSYKKNIKHSESMNGVSEGKNLFDKIYIQRPNVSTEALHNGNTGQTKDDCYYISAEATLENNKKVIIMEKIPAACDVDDTYVHIRSPTTREKISIKAVIERCKAYQDSEEYKTREDLVNSDTSAVITQDQSKPKVLTTSDIAQQNRVKNLREKFQTLNSNVSKHPEMI